MQVKLDVREFAANAAVTPVLKAIFAAKLINFVMEPFKNLRIKKTTAEKFQQFSRQHFKTHSEAMDTMLDFFQYNEISPKERLGPSIRKMETLFKKRINAVITIIKEIEKTQTKPTIGILQALLEQEQPQKKPLLREKKRPSGDRPNYREFNR